MSKQGPLTDEELVHVVASHGDRFVTSDRNVRLLAAELLRRRGEVERFKAVEKAIREAHAEADRAMDEDRRMVIGGNRVMPSDIHQLTSQLVELLDAPEAAEQRSDGKVCPECEGNEIRGCDRCEGTGRIEVGQAEGDD